MAETTYSYTISTDFPGGEVCIDNLHLELEASAIVTALERIDTSGDDIDIVFKAALSAGDKTILDNDTTGPCGGLIAAHDNVASTEVSSVNVTNSPMVTQVQEEDGVQTGGHYGATTLDLTMDTSSGWHEETFSWPTSISILSAQAFFVADQLGDAIELYVAEDTTVGNITQDVSSSATTVYASAATLAYLAVGYWVKLADGTNTDDVGRITAIDTDNFTVETATTNSFATATPTNIKRTVKMIYDFTIPGLSRVEIGETKIGASYVPASTVLKLRYQNNSTTARTISIPIEFLY